MKPENRVPIREKKEAWYPQEYGIEGANEDPDMPPWVGLRDEKDDAVKVTLEMGEDVGIEISHKKHSSVPNMIAERVSGLMKAGAKLEDASMEAVGIHGNVLRYRKEVWDHIKNLNATWTLTAEQRKNAVRQTLNKIMIENSLDPDRHKIALDAAKQIAQDPEVGISTTSPQVGINIDLGELSSVFESLPKEKNEE